MEYNDPRKYYPEDINLSNNPQKESPRTPHLGGMENIFSMLGKGMNADMLTNLLFKNLSNSQSNNNFMAEALNTLLKQQKEKPVKKTSPTTFEEF